MVSGKVQMSCSVNLPSLPGQGEQVSVAYLSPLLRSNDAPSPILLGV